MAKDPAFLFYPNDYIGGTMGMTFEEKGAYMELLMMQFNRGHMTKHMIGQTIGQLWDKIQDKFVKDDQGLYYNKRLEEEKLKRQKYTESRRNNKEGINQYTKKKDKKGGHMTGHMENENENENIDIYKPFLKKFNIITKRQFRILDNKTKRQLRTRLKEGYTIEEIYKAIENCKNDDYHKNNTQYLTPEFITRSDKLQKYLNANNQSIDLSQVGTGTPKKV